MYGIGIEGGALARLEHLLEYLLNDQKRMARAKNYFAWQGRLVRPEIGQRIIEVGCGTGNFTGMLLDRELVVALDVEPVCVERLLDRYPGRRNLEARALSATSVEFAALARLQPDSCVCLNVLEHVEDDQRAVEAMASILVPGGSIVLLLPAYPSLRGPIDHNLGHFRRYVPSDARRLADAAGLRIRKMRFMNSVGLFAWWANAHMFRLQAIPQWQIVFFDTIIAPVLSRLEAIVPPLFGQSLFVVLEKPCR